MKTTYFRLTKSENEIMELLWREGRPLSRSEIIDLTPDRTWKPASIHILLNSMLEKGAIQVAGFVQSTKNYARTFTPTLTADEYAVLQFKHSSAFNEQSVLCLVSALVETSRTRTHWQSWATSWKSGNCSWANVSPKCKGLSRATGPALKTFGP